MIVAVGNEVFTNKDKVIKGTYVRPTVEIINNTVSYAPRGLDYQNYYAPKIVDFKLQTKKVDPPFQQALQEYQKSAGCVNCTTVGPSQ
jgi:hypothetical protein